jgi:hypothetical protein
MGDVAISITGDGVFIRGITSKPSLNNDKYC